MTMSLMAETLPAADTQVPPSPPPLSPPLPWAAAGLLAGTLLLGPLGLAGALGGLALLLLAVVPLPPAMPLARRLLIALALALLGGWLGSIAPRTSLEPHLVDGDATVIRSYQWAWSQGLLVGEIEARRGLGRRPPSRLFVFAPSQPRLRPGDRVALRGLHEVCAQRQRPQLRAVEMEVLAWREQGSRAWAWRAIDGLRRHQDLASRLLLGVGSAAEGMVFRDGGLLHLLAVSGLHLGLALALMALLLRVWCPSWLLRQMVLMAWCGGYLWLTGSALSTRRAAVMVVAVLLAQICGRRPHRLTSLSLAVIILILWDPSQVHELGFQLSVAAVFGIVTLGRELVAWRQRSWPLRPLVLDSLSWRLLLHALRSAVDGLLIGLSATLAVMPLLATHLGRIHPWAPLATVVATPVLTLVLGVGLVVLFIAGPWPHGPWHGAYLLLEWALDALVAIAHWGASWPGASLAADPWPLGAVMIWPLLFILRLHDHLDVLLRMAAVVVVLLLL